MATTSPEVKAALETIFAADSEFYQGRGFQRRIGYGTRPALLVIDMANAWTRPDHAFTCDNMEEIIPATQSLLAAAREKRIPIIFTTTAYQDPTGPRSDTGLWHLKIPVETLLEGSEAASIDDRLDPRPGEQVIVKKRASAFHGTYLAGYLRSQRVDTVIVAGVTMAGCVRHSTEDAIADGFRPIVVREAVGDRVPGVVEWNLFDIDAKFGDVEPLENVALLPEGAAGARQRLSAAPGPCRARPLESWERGRPARLISGGPSTLGGCIPGGSGRTDVSDLAVPGGDAPGTHDNPGLRYPRIRNTGHPP